MALERFVRQVDTKLLERVLLEIFEPKNIEQRNPRIRIRRVNRLVDGRHEPREHVVVDCFADRVAGVDGLDFVELCLNWTLLEHEGCREKLPAHGFFRDLPVAACFRSKVRR